MKKSSMIAMLAIAALFSASAVTASDLPPPKKEICNVNVSVMETPSISIVLTGYNFDAYAFADETPSGFACFILEPAAIEEFPIINLHGRHVDSCFSSAILQTSDKRGSNFDKPTIRKL